MKFFNKIIKGLFQGTDPHYQPEGTVLKNHNGQFIHYQDGSFKWKSAKGTEKINIYVDDFDGSSFDDLGITIMGLTEIDGTIYSLGVDADGKTHIGKFEITDIFEIYSESGSNGTITPVGTSIVPKSSDKTYYFNPDSTYKVDLVTIDGTALTGDDLDLARAANQYTFRNILSDHSIAVAFALKTQYTITISSGLNGSLNPTGIQSVYEGNDLAITVSPDAGYKVLSCTIDGVALGGSALQNVIDNLEYTFTDVQENHTFNVEFEQILVHTIEASSGDNGSISPTGSVLVNTGADQSFTYTPVAGYEVFKLYVDGSIVPNIASGGTYTFTNVSENHSIFVMFQYATVQHEITITSNSYGTTSPSGVQLVDYGGSLIINFYPDTGYHVRDIEIDGVMTGITDSSYTFNNVTEDHEIYVIFDDQY